MRLSENKIDDVRNSVDIVEEIGAVVRLKKSGQNFMGLCPFHPEKTPSFSVHPGKQIYKCFGCGEGGNVFTFLMKDQSITFYDAVRQLAEKAGIQLPQYQEDVGEKQQVEKLFVINEFASKWYQNNLSDPTAGKAAREYIASRGYKDEIIETFEIGYAPDEWEGLVKAARKSSFDARSLSEAGLALSRQSDSSPYDRFRNRIVFPVKNEFGKTVGFGARKFVDSEDKNSPKYINSPETPVYQKGKLLYGLFQNKESIRKHDLVIIVEGYTDVISLYQYGIKLGVATLGTSLTRRQAQLINRYTKNVVLLYDADAPGVKAAIRGAEVLLAANLDVQIVNLGGNSDPDSFLKNNSREAFLKAVEDRQSIVDFYSSSFDDTGRSLTYNEKTDRIRTVIDLVNSVSDRLKRDLMLKEIGEKLNADMKSVFKEFYNKQRSSSRFRAGTGQRTPEIRDPLEGIDWVEREFGAIIVKSPQLAGMLLDSVSIQDIRSNDIRRIVEIVREFKEKDKKFDPADIISATDDQNLHRLITSLAFDPNEFPRQDEHESFERLQQAAEDVVKFFQKRVIERELNDVQEQIKKTETEGADPTSLNTRYEDLLRRKNEVSLQK